MDWNDLIAQQKPEKPKYTAKEKRGCIVLAVILLIVLLIAHKILHTKWMAACAFGTMFLFCGIAIAKQERKSPKPQWRLPVLCFSISAVSIVSGFLQLLSSVFHIEVLPNDKRFGDCTTAVLFLAAGIGILAYLAAGLVHKKRYCTERVEALCTDLIRKRSRHIVYTPVYEYFYGGTTHQVHDTTASDFANPNIGDTRFIYIDPEHHDEMLDPKRQLRVVLLPAVLALFLIGIAVWVLLS